MTAHVNSKRGALTPSQTARAVGDHFQQIVCGYFTYFHRNNGPLLSCLSSLLGKEKAKWLTTKSHKMALDKEKAV